MRLLAEDATANLDAKAQEIEDAAWSLTKRSASARSAREREHIRRAQKDLKAARIHQAAIRRALLLDEDEPDGLS